MRCCAALLATLLIVATGTTEADAQTKYWDIDVISRAGAGSATPSGTWSSIAAKWNTDFTGLGIPTTWTAGDTAAFAAGSNATGAYTVTVSGTQSLSGLTVEEGAITQNGGILDFGFNFGASVNIATGAAWVQTSSARFIGGGGIEKNGAGTLVLRGNNTISNTGSGDQPFLTINDGIVDFVADANLGADPSFPDNGTALTINGGTLRYSGTSTFALATARGVFVGSNGATFDIVDDSVTLALPAGANPANTLTGSGTITKAGLGRFRLQTAQTTFTGKYVVEGGSLTFPSEDRLGATPATTQADYFTLDGGGLYGDLATGATLNAKRGITLGASGGYLAFSGTGLSYDGIIAGTQAGALSLTTADAAGTSSTGTISLNSANTYNGPTLVANGMTLSVGTLVNGGINSAIGSSSNVAANLILDGGTLLYRGAATSTDRNFTITATAPCYIDASGAAGAPLTFTSTAPIGLNGTGLHILGLRGTSTGDNTLSQSIVDQGTAATTLNKLDAGTWVLKNTANTYTGNTVIGGGRLKLGASGVIPDLSLVQLSNAATFDLNGFDETVRSVSGTAGTIALGSKTLTLNNPSGESYSASITGAGGGRIVKNGAGKFTLSPATATYDGGLTLNAGALGVGTSSALGTGTFVVNNSATLAAAVVAALSLTNPVTLNGDLTFNDSFIPTPGAITWGTSGANKWTLSGANRTITVNTAAGGYGVTINQVLAQDAEGLTLFKSGNGTLTLNGANTYTGATYVLAGTLSVSKVYFPDWRGVVVDPGAILNLNYPANTPDTVAGLRLNGIFQSYGTWGAIGSGAQYETAQITGTGRLIVKAYFAPIPGDFNSDGVVNNGDYITWRRASGTSNPLPNDNGLGTPIGLAHYNLWRQLYGGTAGGGTSNGLTGGTIPEPTSMLLILFGVVGMTAATSRWQR